MAGDEITIKTVKNTYGYAPKQGGILLNGKQMAAYAGVSEQAFHKSWIGAGCPSLPNPKNPSEKIYSSASVMKWRFDRDCQRIKDSLIGQVEISQGEMTIAEAERRKKQADALLSEFALADKQELVANIDDIMTNVGAAFENITASLLGWRANLVGQLTMKREEVVDKVLREEIGRVLNNLHDLQHEYVENDKEE